MIITESLRQNKPDTRTNVMSANITDILGYHSGRVYAIDDSDLIYHASPDLIPELVGDHYAKSDAVAWAKRCCVHACIHFQDWRWETFEPANPHLFRCTIKAFSRERWGWPYWSRRNVNDPAMVLGQ